MSAPWVLTLWLAGVACLAVELFVPGMIVGVIGFALVVASVVGAWVGMGPAVGGGLALGSLATGAVLLKLAAARMTLRAPARAEAAPEQAEAHPLVGRTGEAVTDLRPSGFATLDGRRTDVVTRGEHVAAGARVEVVEVEGTRVVVRPLP